MSLASVIVRCAIYSQIHPLVYNMYGLLHFNHTSIKCYKNNLTSTSYNQGESHYLQAFYALSLSVLTTRYDRG